MSETISDGLRTLLSSTTLTDEEAVLVFAVRFLIALDAAGLPLPAREKAAVIRSVDTYMRRQNAEDMPDGS